MKDIKPILRSLGLLDSEVNTYLAGFENGPSTVLELTKVTGLSRQATYVAIQSLADRGIMTSFLRGKKRYYAAEHPDRLLSYARKRQDDMSSLVRNLKSSIPELELQMGGERPHVRLYEGKEGVRAIFEDIKKAKPKEAYEIADSEAFDKVVDRDDAALVGEEFVKQKTQIQGIYTNKPETQSIKGDRIYLSGKDTGFKADLFVYGSKVALISLKGKQHSVIVESAEIAEAMRVLFRQAFKK